MKKLILGLALVAGTFTFAQKTSTSTSSSSPVRFGVKAGLNVSSISNSDLNSKAGFYGGVFANIPVAQDFSVQPEVLYSGLGGKAKSNSSAKINMDYIAVPVMLQYNLIPNLYVEAGPQFGFLISAKGKSNGVSVDIKDNLKTFDFGIGLGAGYYFTQNIGVNVRYTAGLSDVPKNNTGDASRNGVFQVGLAYKF
jgi:opacity protein-like surface antigen